MSLISLDAREILFHLNNMGYRNITADHLKEFMRDLKKLIKYETLYSNVQLETPPHASQKSSNQPQLPQLQNEIKNLTDHFEYLYLTSTASSRAKLVKKEQKRNSLPITTITTSDAATGIHKNRRIPKDNINTVSKTIKENVPDKIKNIQTPKLNKQSSDKENKLCTKDLLPKTVYIIRNTPTDLYQQYQKDWSRYKRFVPGENSRADVREEIRKRMKKIQTPKPKPKVYLTVNTNQDKIITRC